MSDAKYTAAAIRKELKAAGIKASVRKDGYNCVRVQLDDLPSETVYAIREKLGKYQEGHFNGMTDCYEYSNTRDDIPQSKFVFVDCSYSDGLRAAAEEYAKRHYDVDPIRSEFHFLVGRILRTPRMTTFWAQFKPRQRAA